MFPTLPKSSPPAASQAISPKAVTDGLSKTMIVGEMAGRGYNYGQTKFSGTWAIGSNTGNLQLQISGPPTTGFPSPLTMANYATWCPAYKSDELISFHPSGGQILLADGSVQFLIQETSVAILCILASRNGNEPLEEGVIGN